MKRLDRDDSEELENVLRRLSEKYTAHTVLISTVMRLHFFIELEQEMIAEGKLVL